MKAISELNKEVTYPDGDELFVVSQKNPDTDQWDSFKLKLSVLRDFILWDAEYNSSYQEDIAPLQ